MNLEHHYSVTVDWTGNRGTGTSTYRAYGRDHTVTAVGKPTIAGSSDRAFHGDIDRWNPEELLLAALAQCHMLSYLHVATSHGITVVAYEDAATGTMQQTADGGGHFTSATLRPVVTITLAGSETSADDAVALASTLHHEASGKCFIAASVNFPVGHEPRVIVA